MHITKLVLDGFKSYGTRTEIKGFDPEFNAITGLNGTGKSNILDSICFVLGITNLVNVRALNLVDLIYKSGQAGVTKATVTIFFDNSDPTKSPLNYEHQKEITVSRQIVVGGKNRYMINGIAVNNKTIFDFFKSVQLNVNNPHFLIMQGRITKVLNMKPPEILSMIEEAAGTSMYEHKKNLAQRTVEKKDTKLKEMDDMVLEQINPKMQRLKDERSQYFEYQKIQKEVESLHRITTAYKFTTAEQSLIKSQQSLESIIAEIEALTLKRMDSESQVKSLEAAITELNKKIDSEKGGTLCELEAQVHDLEKAEAKATAEYKNTENMVNSETKKRKLLVQSLAEDEKAFIAKKAEMDKAGSVFSDLRETQQKDAEALAAAERKLQAVEQGKLSSEDGEDASLQDQLMAANEQLKDAETEVKMCAMQVEQAQKELKVKLPEFKQTESTLSNDSKDLEKKERELNNIENQLRNSNYQEGQLEQLEDQLKSVNNDIRICNDTVTKFGNRYPHLRFTYSDPEPNFDRRQVRGLLCTLFSVKDERFARALETAAGGKLYNVVVENENVSSKLIKNGRLTKRTTFAPINKIQGHKMNQNLIRKAQNLVGAGNVFCAQDLIEYDRDYETIMAWAFGQTFICMDSNAAMKICDSNDIQSKAVTLEGDVFDPAGIISGGAVVKTDPILRTLINLKNAERDVKVKQKEQESIMKQIESLRVIAETDRVRKRLHTEVGMIRARVQITPHYQLKQEIQELKQKISEMTTRMDERKKEIKEKEKKVKELEYKMKNLKTIKDNELKAAQAELKKAEKRAEESKKRWIQREQEYENLNLEIQELEKAVATGKTELATSEESVAKFKAESAELKQRLSEIQTTVKNMKSQVKMAEDEIGKKNSEIKSLVDKKEKLIKNACDCGVAVTSKEVEKTKAQEDIQSAHGLVNEMKRKYKWIETDREYFGQPNGLYDFNSNDPIESANKLRKLESMKEKLDKLVNVKALDVLGSQEEQFQEVLNKKVIVEEDRSKILSVIEELDVKKEEVIKTAWEQVNHDFNSILNTLLPGFNAKLQPVQGKDFMDGLQIKVGLGGIWKETLDELSGGQRSLVALSLILAMLLFRPAPLYILDEVDAALDQSHTQNIGQMLKKHFKQSQFIVVSLKDGMFTNANVLYRTSFVDGMSQVKRTTPNQQH